MAIYNATSVSSSDVQAAMNLANSPGDTVIIPAGSSNWTTGVSWTNTGIRKLFNIFRFKGLALFFAIQNLFSDILGDCINKLIDIVEPKLENPLKF